MPLHVEPPDDDNRTSRHKFYMAIATALDNNTKAMTGISGKLEEISSKHGTVAQEFRDLQTTIRTTIRIAGVLVVMFSSVSAMVLKQAWDISDRVQSLERRSDIFRVSFKPHEDLPEKVQALHSRIDNLEMRVANMEKVSK